MVCGCVTGLHSIIRPDQKGAALVPGSREARAAYFEAKFQQEQADPIQRPPAPQQADPTQRPPSPQQGRTEISGGDFGQPPQVLSAPTVVPASREVRADNIEDEIMQVQADPIQRPPSAQQVPHTRRARTEISGGDFGQQPQVLSEPRKSLKAVALAKEELHKLLAEFAKTDEMRITSQKCADLLINAEGGTLFVIIDLKTHNDPNEPYLPFRTLDPQRRTTKWWTQSNLCANHINGCNFPQMLQAFCAHSVTDRWERDLLDKLCAGLGLKADVSNELQEDLYKQVKDGAVILSSDGYVKAAAVQLTSAPPEFQMLKSDGKSVGTKHAGALSMTVWMQRRKIHGVVFVRSDAGGVHALLPAEGSNDPKIYHLPQIQDAHCDVGPVDPVDPVDWVSLHVSLRAAEANREIDIIRDVLTCGKEFCARGRCYTVKEELGSGGFGIVFRITDAVRPSIDLAAKVVAGSGAESLVVEILVSILLRRQGALALPIIFAVDEISLLDGSGKPRTFLVLLMEKAKRAFTDMQVKQQPMPEEQIRRHACSLLHTLHLLHKVKLIHSDIKPANILFDSEGDVMLADFGCAATFKTWPGDCFLRCPRQHGSFQRPVIGMSLSHAPPEMGTVCAAVRNSTLVSNSQVQVTEKADLWSWALLTLEIGALGTDHQQELESLLNERVQRKKIELSAEWYAKVSNIILGLKKNSGCPDFWADIEKCLQQNPAQRPSVSEVLENLKKISQRNDESRLDRQLALEKLLDVELQAFELFGEHKELQKFCWEHLSFHNILDSFCTEDGEALCTGKWLIQPRTMILQSIRQCYYVQSANTTMTSDYCAQFLARAAGQLSRQLSPTSLKEVLGHPRLKGKSSSARVDLLNKAALLIAEKDAGESACVEVLLEMALDMEKSVTKYTDDDLEAGTAAKEGNCEMLRFQMEIQGRNLAYWADDRQRTLAHYAARCGQIPVLQLLQGTIPDVLHSRDSFSDTPLHLAVIAGYRNVVEQLLGWQADVNCCDMWGFTPLHLAVVHGKPDIYQLLATWGAEEDARDYRGRTPQHIACDTGFLAHFQFALQHGQ